MSTSSKRILSEVCLSEAYIEFPDGEFDAVHRVLAGAQRRGAIPRDALENWPMERGFASRPTKKAAAQQSAPPAKSKPTTRPSPKVAPGDSPAPDTRSGRVIPATNRFRQQVDAGDSGETPVATKAKASKERPTGPGLVKRLAAKATGKDPETGLPKPKSAVTKVHGPRGPATSLPRLDRMFGSGDGDEFSDDEKTDPGYVSPFAHIPGLGDDDEPGDSPDPKLDVIRKGLSRARPHAPRPNVGFPEADAWERFGKDPAGPPSPAAGKRKQGRLSRLFRGRRDDDV